MDAVWGFISEVNDFVWGWPTLLLLSGAGVVLTVGLGFIQFRKFGFACRELIRGRKGDGSPGDISPFNSLMTAMSGTVGAGNIAGVAVAVSVGGPGALFYMWLIGLLGMATKYSECMLGAAYRQKASDGSYAGGPMFYMKNGIGGSLGKVLAVLYASALIVAGFGVGNMFQAKTISDVIASEWGIPTMATGAVLAVLVALVIIGGIKRIGEVVGKVVPTMIILYIASGLWVIATNIGEIGNALSTIFGAAFGLDAAAGGAVGGGIMLAMRQGFARGLFSNESGMGSAAIAHASAQTKDPIKQGHIAMLGTFIDTILVCTITGLSIVMTGVLTDGSADNLTGAQITAVAFGTGLSHVVVLALSLFVFTTVLAWYYYCERGLIYFGANSVAIRTYKAVWILVVFISTTTLLDLGNVILISDTLSAMMIYPNLIALLILAPVIFRKTNEYWRASESQ